MFENWSFPVCMCARMDARVWRGESRPSVVSCTPDLLRDPSKIAGLSPQHNSESCGMTNPIFLFLSLFHPSPCSQLPSVTHLTFFLLLHHFLLSHQRPKCQITPLTDYWFIPFAPTSRLPCSLMPDGEKHSVMFPQCSKAYCTQGVWEKSKQMWKGPTGNMTDSWSKCLRILQD